MNEYLTTAQVAERLGNKVKPRTVVGWIHQGILPAIRVPTKRGAFLISPDDLDKLTKYIPETEEPS